MEDVTFDDLPEDDTVDTTLNLRCYTVWDAAASAYITPFFLPTDAMALRVFKDSANDPSHMFCRHPQDYDLFRIGDFNPNTGKIRTSPVKHHLASALTLKEHDTRQGDMFGAPFLADEIGPEERERLIREGIDPDQYIRDLRERESRTGNAVTLES